VWLGFRDDLALVTVSLLERTKKNCLNVQPYRVTSTRGLKRLGDEQIIRVLTKKVPFRNSFCSQKQAFFARPGKQLALHEPQWGG
jgi:hypothetical protein